MGLDFMGIAIRKDEIQAYGSAIAFLDYVCDKDYELWKERELFYSRKSWELVHELGCDTQDECMSELTIEKWIDLQEKLAPIGPSLEAIHTAYQAEDHATAQDKWLIKQYEKWYDACFDEYPQLGYYWSVGYMKTFWEAADEVLKYLEDPDWEVWMIASY